VIVEVVFWKQVVCIIFICTHLFHNLFVSFA
jgi:hypothetical protein